MRLSRSLLAVLIAWGLAGCAGASDAAPTASEKMEIVGEVVRVELEGGFWGIVDRDGRRYDPSGLPSAFQQAGLKVRVHARADAERLSFRMWGRPIVIEHIERRERP